VFSYLSQLSCPPSETLHQVVVIGLPWTNDNLNQWCSLGIVDLTRREYSEVDMTKLNH